MPSKENHNGGDRTSDERLSDFGFSRADNMAILAERGICWLHWPDEEWTFQYYFSTRGQESFHIYFWLIKDLTWVQGWYVEGILFGTLAVAWQVYMMCKAVYNRSFEETVCSTGMFFWLFGKCFCFRIAFSDHVATMQEIFGGTSRRDAALEETTHFYFFYYRMLGELHDSQYPHEDSVYDRYARQASYMLITAMAMVCAYYGIVKPFNLVPSNPIIDKGYNDTGLQCRFPKFFRSWREYENIHILFWAGKDTAWNLDILPMWICFGIPTFLIALDFMWVSLNAKRGVIDHAHYVAQFMWVFANAVWALGEFTLTPDHDEPIGTATAYAAQQSVVTLEQNAPFFLVNKLLFDNVCL